MACGLFIRSQVLTNSDPGGTLSFLFFDDNCDGSASGTGTVFPTITGDDLYVDFTGFIAGCYWLRYEAPDYDGACEYDPIDYYIEVLDSADAGTGVSIELCTTDPVQNIFNALGGSPDSTGVWSGSGITSAGYTPGTGIPTDDTFDPSLMNEGDVVSFIYTVDPSGISSGATIYDCDNCDPQVAVVTYQIVPCPNPCTVDAGTGNSINVCIDCGFDAFSYLQGTPDSGGVWTMITGLNSVIVGNFITVYSAGFYEFKYTVTDPIDPLCTHSAILSVIAFAPPYAGAPVLSVVELCETDGTYSLGGNLSGGTSNGYWVGPGLPNGIFDPILGTLTPASGDGGFSGTYTFVAEVPAGLISDCVAACSDQVSFDVDILEVCDAGGFQSVQVCLDDATPLNLQTVLGGVAIDNLRFLGFDDPDDGQSSLVPGDFAINGILGTYSISNGQVGSPFNVSLFQNEGVYFFSHQCNQGQPCNSAGGITIHVVDCLPACQPSITIAQDAPPDGCDFTATPLNCPNWPATAIIQWQQLIGLTWTDIAGATGATYSHTNSNPIRAKLSNCGGGCPIVYSNSLQHDCPTPTSCSIVASCVPSGLPDNSVDFSWVLTGGSGCVIYNIQKSVTGTLCSNATGWTAIPNGSGTGGATGTINVDVNALGGGFYRLIVQDCSAPLTCNDQCCINTADTLCDFYALIWGQPIVRELWANGADILTGAPFDLAVPAEVTSLDNELDSWLTSNGGGTATVAVPRDSTITINDSSEDFDFVEYDSDYDNAGTLPTLKSYFDNTDCGKTCDYFVNLSGITMDIYQMRTNYGNAITTQYDIANAIDRANMKADIENFLTAQGCSGFTVNITATSVQILNSCVAFNYVLDYPTGIGGNDSGNAYQFNQTNC